MSGLSGAIQVSIMASSSVLLAFGRFLLSRPQAPSILPRYLPNLQFSPPFWGNTACGPSKMNSLHSRTVMRRGVHFHSHESRSLLPHAFVVKAAFCLPTVDPWTNIKVLRRALAMLTKQQQNFWSVKSITKPSMARGCDIAIHAIKTAASWAQIMSCIILESNQAQGTLFTHCSHLPQ